MAKPAAVTSNVQLKSAACPHQGCGYARIYFTDPKGKPQPLDDGGPELSALQYVKESKEATEVTLHRTKTKVDEGLETERIEVVDTFEDVDSSWTVDELIGVAVKLDFADPEDVSHRYLNRRTVKSNTANVVTLTRPIACEDFTDLDGVLVTMKIRRDKLPNPKKFYNKHQFVCPNCSTVYTVDKP